MVVEERGNNHPFIGGVDSLAEVLGISPEKELLVIAGMAVADSERSVAEETQSIQFFITNLGTVVNQEWIETRAIQEWFDNADRVDVIAQGKALAKTWLREARQAVAELVTIKDQAEKHWQQLTRGRG